MSILLKIYIHNEIPIKFPACLCTCVEIIKLILNVYGNAKAKKKKVGRFRDA